MKSDWDIYLIDEDGNTKKISSTDIKVGDIVKCDDLCKYGISQDLRNGKYIGYKLDEKGKAQDSEIYIIEASEILEIVPSKNKPAINKKTPDVKIPKDIDNIKNNDKRNDRLLKAKEKVENRVSEKYSKYNDLHYTSLGVQPMEVIKTWPIQQQVGFFRGNIIKYAMRLGNKDAGVSEASKILRYAQWLYCVLSGEDIDLKK